MKYISTRGGISPISFEEAVMQGQAADGGLLMPATIPNVATKNDEWRNLSFAELANEIASLFASGIEKLDLSKLLEDAFSTFDVAEVVPLKDVRDMFVLELFHGPTLAFKDIALQVLGRLFEYILDKRQGKLNILGATSGDTGSAAIAGVRGRKGIEIFVMFPEGRVSSLQELQMTAIPDRNVHCMAIQGSFDDCQRIMKTIFNDVEFKEQYSLGAINSINWARLMVQIVYYYYAALKFDVPITFSVPTGNFGNILSGIIAKHMGAPIEKLILGTNENDILASFFSTGRYERGQVHQTLSPSMDIQVSSNLERYLYLHMDENSTPLAQFMQTFIANGMAVLPSRGEVDPTILAKRVDTETTLTTIQHYWQNERYLLDPHTAIGVAAAKAFDIDTPIVSLATAHPAKFPDAIRQATGLDGPTHPRLESLDSSLARKTILPADEVAVREYLDSNLR